MFLIYNPLRIDPAFNFAFEEYLLRESKEEYLFLYINDISIIVGRNQNPFLETNLKFILKNNINVYRRISGGGAVYHDKGNLNFSFITNFSKEKFNNYEYFISPIIQILKNFGIICNLNEKNDIVYSNLKISGNAQFTTSDRMISHGTLLFDSDVAFLKNSLKLNDYNISTNARLSVPSSVINLKSIIPGISIDLFLSELENYFPNKLDLNDLLKEADLTSYIEKYNSWEWRIRRTPDFILSDNKSGVKLHFEKGYIKEIYKNDKQININDRKLTFYILAKSLSYIQ